MDVSIFEGRIKNDETGAPAYDPRILLKIVFYAYARGIISSRDIQYRKRDPRFASVERHRNPVDKSKWNEGTRKFFGPDDFKKGEATGKLICPAGRKRVGSRMSTYGEKRKNQMKVSEII